MDPPLVHESSFTSSAAPSSYGLPEIWQLDSGSVLRRGHFGQNLSFPVPPGPAGNASIEESTVTEQSGGHGGRKKRRDAAAVVASEDESSKLASTCSGNDAREHQACLSCGCGNWTEHTDCNGKRLKPTGSGEENGDLKADAEASSGNGNKAAEHNAQPSEAPKQDYIHVRARRGQATDSHSLAERARREKISERMKILQDLVPGCNKVIGKALVLDEIINYIQSLQRQVEFLSMKLEAVNSRMNASMDVFPGKDFGVQTFDASGLPFSSQPPREYGQESPSEWLHMQVGGTGGFDRAT